MGAPTFLPAFVAFTRQSGKYISREDAKEEDIAQHPEEMPDVNAIRQPKGTTICKCATDEFSPGPRAVPCPQHVRQFGRCEITICVRSRGGVAGKEPPAVRALVAVAVYGYMKGKSGDKSRALQALREEARSGANSRQRLECGASAPLSRALAISMAKENQSGETNHRVTKNTKKDKTPAFLVLSLSLMFEYF